MPAYEDVLLTLRELEDANGVLSVYICYMDSVTGKSVCIADGTFGEKKRPVGACAVIEQRNLELMSQGIYDFPSYITNYAERGWLCSASVKILAVLYPHI